MFPVLGTVNGLPKMGEAGISILLDQAGNPLLEGESSVQLTTLY